MPLDSGTKLGPYEIVEPLGAGGMGEVYRGRDTRLERTVAIKILPAHLSNDPVRKQRFEREAKTISSLNHPHICVLHDVGHQDEVDYLVMECVEGETLAKRLQKGPLPLDQVLKYGAQIADALDKAHRAGIVHRDLKPGNIMLTGTGAKLLDFGLAKPATPLSAATITSVSPNSPVTEQGTIVGTFQYMSPEQVEGKELDGRSDIFSLGAVLYEMLTGRRAFEGKSQLSVASAILEKEPAPISAVKPLTPPALDHAVRKCFAKLPDERWQSASDLKAELEWVAHSGVDSHSVLAFKIRAGKRLQVYASFATIAALTLAVLFWRETTNPRAGPSEVRFALALPASEPVALDGGPALAFSPDGRRFAYVVHRGNTTQLSVRDLDSLENRVLSGTEGAQQPFFSWDGQWLAFQAEGKLKKISVIGGSPIVICEVGEGSGGTWLSDGTIILNADFREGLRRVSAGGGTAVVLTRPDVKHSEAYHWWPEALPNGQAVVFTDMKGPSRAEASVAVFSLKDGKWKTVIDRGSSPHYLEGGRILYERDGAFLAAPFDTQKLTVTGPSLPVLQGVLYDLDANAAHIAVSRQGSVAYVPGTMRPLENMLVKVDRTGHETPLTNLRRSFEDLALSPDGQFLALTLRGELQWNVWLYDLARGTLNRVTFEGDNRDPIWTPDGKRLVYGSFRNGHYGIFAKPIAGSESDEQLVAAEFDLFPYSFSRNGRFSYTLGSPSAERPGIYLVGLEGERKATQIVSEPHAFTGAISPDGKFLAYESRASGRSEVYVKELPPGTRKWQISSEGGIRPMWSANGRELFFRSGEMRSGSTLMSVAIQTERGFSSSAPRSLFAFRCNQGGHDYAVLPDGQYFFCIKEPEETAVSRQVNVILNWSANLNK